MATLEQPEFNAPIPGMGMTAELGGRPSTKYPHNIILLKKH